MFSVSWSTHLSKRVRNDIRFSRCGGLSLHVWVGWVGEIKNGLIAAAWGALYKLTSDLTQYEKL